MVTTKDIAKKLGFSVSTVGRALADDARISEQTKLAVRAAAEELGYVGNLAARMMRGGSPTNSVTTTASSANRPTVTCDRCSRRMN